MPNLFSSEEILKIEQEISLAEEKTSGEIRVFIDEKCRIDVLDRAAYIFKQLEMDKTQERNGVLIYLASRDRKFAIIGDKGINEKVPENFWNAIRDTMQQLLKNKNYFEAVRNAIEQSGTELAKFFPRKEDDQNELSNEILFGK